MSCGRESLFPSRAEKQSVRLELTVRSFDLPLRGKLRTQFSFHPGMWEAWYHPECARKAYGIPASAPAGSAYSKYFRYSGEAGDLLSEKDWFLVYDFLLAHRLSPVFIYNTNSARTHPRIFPPLEHLSCCYDRGMNTACAAFLESAMDTPEKELPLYEKDIVRHLDGIAAFAKKADWKDFTWTVHMEDESEIKYGKSREKSDRIIRRMNDLIRTNIPSSGAKRPIPIFPACAEVSTSGPS